MRSAIALNIACLLSLATALAGQNRLPPIDTDRPDLTDGTGTVARGHIQLESGYSRITSRTSAGTYSWPELLLRVGISHALELRVADTYRSAFAGAPGVASTGWGDIQFGSKFQLAGGNGIRPAISGEAFVSLPSGAAAISAARALPGAALLMQWDGGSPWSAGTEIQASRGQADGVDWIPSLSIQFREAPAVQFYGEIFSQQSTSAAVPVETYFNGGVLVLLSNSVQVDARLGAGLNAAASRSLFGFGIALRR